MFIPHSPEEIKSLLEESGLKNIKKLFAQIPQNVQEKANINIDAIKDQQALIRFFKNLAEKNTSPPPERIFAGGGAYLHFIPAAEEEILSRTEFYTAYTPYQPEVSQGTLQAIFEFQTMIADIFGMEVANASMYDGASSLAEAVLMAKRLDKKRDRKLVFVASNIHPEYIQVVKTYLGSSEIEIAPLPYNEKSGKIEKELLKASKEAFAWVIGYPNFFGIIEDVEEIRAMADEKEVKLITVTQEPFALGIFESPGEFGTDIAVGEGQSFGIQPYFGGPGLGLFTTKMEFVRQMPGRLVGETVDNNGNRGYVLTLATREQHIRREKATSNICSNQGLNALAATVYLALVGKEGFRRISEINYKLAHYAFKNLIEIEGISPVFTGEFFNEFVLKIPEEKVKRAIRENFMPGIPLEKFFSRWKDLYLFSFTEINTLNAIDALKEVMER